jgi:hypothetical protein
VETIVLLYSSDNGCGIYERAMIPQEGRKNSNLICYQMCHDTHKLFKNQNSIDEEGEKTVHRAESTPRITKHQYKLSQKRNIPTKCKHARQRGGKKTEVKCQKKQRGNKYPSKSLTFPQEKQQKLPSSLP